MGRSIVPNGRPGDYQTYTIRRRPDTVIKAACEQVGCEYWRSGWRTTVDETTDLGRSQAAWIRGSSGRTFRESKSDGLTVFIFDSGQRCFTDHQTIMEKFRVRGGDYRKNLGLIREHTNGVDWAEDLVEHLGRIDEERNRG